MRFAFTDDQLLFRDTVARPARQGVPARAGARTRGPTTTAALPELWARAGRDGRARACTVPEAHGGLGLTELDLVLLLEEAGRVGLPDPIVETAAVAAPLLAEVGSPDAAPSDWLPGASPPATRW